MTRVPTDLDTRERLLRAAVDVFGRHGFAGTSTRALAAAAGANLQAIAYYFGSKEGLRAAAVEHIAKHFCDRMGPAHGRALARLRLKSISASEARELLVEQLSALAAMLLHESSEPMARFIVREQMEPSAAFGPLYERVLEPQFDTAAKLVGLLLKADPRSARVRLRTQALLGSIIFLRIGRAGVLRQLRWKQTGPRELAAVRALIQETVACIVPAKL